MRQTILIALNDLRVYFSERGNLVGLVVLPIALTLLLGWAFSNGGNNTPEKIRVDLIDLDQTAASEQFIAQLRAVNDTLILCPTDATDGNCNLDDEETLTIEQSIERVQSIDTRALIVIPAGYGEAVAAAQPITLDYYARSDGTGGFNDPVLGSVQTVSQRINAAIQTSKVGLDIADSFTVAGQPVNVFDNEDERAAFATELRSQAEAILSAQSDAVNFVLTSGEAETQSLGTGFGQAVPGQGATFVMFTVLGGMAILLRERREWTLQRMMVLPLSRAQVLGGKILTFVALGMIQFTIVFIVGVFTGVNFGNAPFAILLLMLAFVLASTSIAFAIATRLTHEGQATGVALLLSFIFAPLGGAWWPLEIVPAPMRIAGHFTPTAWVMDGFTDIIFYGGNLLNVLPEIGVLLVIAGIFFTLGIAGFRYE